MGGVDEDKSIEIQIEEQTKSAGEFLHPDPRRSGTDRELLRIDRGRPVGFSVYPTLLLQSSAGIRDNRIVSGRDDNPRNETGPRLC